MYSVHIQYLLSYIKKFIYHLPLSLPETRQSSCVCLHCGFFFFLLSFPFERFSVNFYSKAFAVYFIRRSHFVLFCLFNVIYLLLTKSYCLVLSEISIFHHPFHSFLSFLSRRSAIFYKKKNIENYLRMMSSFI